MIFVVLGTQKFHLNRLLKQIDDYIEAGLIQEEVLAQIGHSSYIPKHYSYVTFLDKNEYDIMIQKADLVITHSGVGTIMTAIAAKKPIVVFPRLAKYQEHVDDHQLDIAKAFDKKSYVVCCYETHQLLDKIYEARNKKFDTYVSNRGKMVSLIQNFLEEP